jgi:hypothetical protein
VCQLHLTHRLGVVLQRLINHALPSLKVNKMLTVQFPPPNTPDPPGPLSPKVNILSTPFWMTTKTSNQVLSLARLPVHSQYCFRHKIPSLAHGAPRRASSSSVMLIVVESEASLCVLRVSSSCVSRIMVCDKLEAKPSAGKKFDELEA